MHELKMAVVAQDMGIRKAMWWNFAFATVAIFLQSFEFGENDLAGKSDRLSFVADFVDEILAYNAQAWDKERHFMSAQEVGAKWSSQFLRVFGSGGGAGAGNLRNKDSGDRSRRAESEFQKVPQDICKSFQNGKCNHPGDRYSAYWDTNLVLQHDCTKFVKEKKRFCFGKHPRKDHK